MATQPLLADATRENTRAFLDMASVLRGQPPLVLVGAGLSVPLGYPQWTDLLAKMKGRSARHGSAERAHQPRHGEEARRADPLWYADVIRSALGEGEYHALLQDAFASKPHKPPTRAMRALLRLEGRHYLTTNFEDSLERALGAEDETQPLRIVDWDSRADVRRFFGAIATNAPERHLVYLHGRIVNPRRCVLTERDYVDRYVRSDDTQRKLFALFATRPVLFVGFSFADPQLTAIVRTVNATLGRGRGHHFAIMQQPKDDEGWVREYYRQKLGVTPVFYPYSANHEELADVLDVLAEAKAGDPRQAVKQLPALHEVPTAVDPGDPRKGQFGGARRAGGLAVTATVVRDGAESDWYQVTVEVRGTARRPLRGPVDFHVHPTFEPDVVRVPARNGVARWQNWAYGAFTVGVTAGATKLEYDLADAPGADGNFRAR